MEEKLAELQRAAKDAAAELHDLGLEIERLERRRDDTRMYLAHVNGQVQGYVAAMQQLVATGVRLGDEPTPPEQAEAR